MSKLNFYQVRIEDKYWYVDKEEKSSCIEHGTKKKFEYPTGFQPMTS